MNKLWIYVSLILFGVLTLVGASFLNQDAGLTTAGGFIVGFGLILTLLDYFMDSVE